MLLSVVILTCNQKEVTLRCLRSICELISDPECEVILVDNGSTDGTAEDVSRLFPEVRPIRLDTNRGVAAGRNSGLQICSGKYLMILDNDTIADRDTIFGLARYLESHPDVGLVAPRLVSPGGETQSSFRPFPGLLQKIRNVILGKNRTSVTTEVPDREIEPFYVIGAAQMFPRGVYAAAGPLDEKIFYGPEDADFCMAVRNVGKRVVYCPQFTIVHDWQRKTTGNILSAAGRRHTSALLYFYLKHHRFL